MVHRMATNVLLTLSLVLASIAATAAPLAASFKSISNITSIGPGTNTCPPHRVPVAASGNGTDTFGEFTFTEQFCANPLTGQASGQFTIVHNGAGSLLGGFNGTFVPSGQILEVHATWRISGGTGQFSHVTGAGTGKGIASVVNGGPGPGTVLLDGVILVP
jgi:hypothetical protein